MAKRPTLADTNAGFSSAATQNANNDAIEIAFDNTLSRDGSTPNQMLADLDMNSNRVINVATGVAGTDAVNVTQANALINTVGKYTTVGSYAALRDLSPSAGDVVQLTDSRAGTFQFNAASLTTEVTADEVTVGEGDGGIYVAPASDPTGASGAWVRIFSGPLDAAWYGVVSDNTTDDANAINTAVATGRAVFLAQGTADTLVGTTIAISTLGQRFGGLDELRLEAASGFTAASPMISVTERRVTIRELDLRCASNATHGIYGTGNNCNRLGVYDVYISSPVTNGLLLEDDTWMSRFERVRVDSSGGAAFRAIQSGGGGNTTHSFTNCYAASPGGYGFDFSDINGVSMAACAVDGAGTFAFNFERCQVAMDGVYTELSEQLFRVISGTSYITVQGGRFLNYGAATPPAELIDNYGTLVIENCYFLVTVAGTSYTNFARVRDGSVFCLRNTNINLNDETCVYETGAGQTVTVRTDPMVLRRTTSAIDTNVTGDGTVHTITWDSTEHIEGFTSNNLTGPGDRFTARVPGVYRVRADIRLAGLTASHTDGYVNVLLNGTTYVTGDRLNVGAIRTDGDVADINVDAVVPMDSGDYVQIAVVVENGTLVVDVSPNATILQVERIGDTYTG